MVVVKMVECVASWLHGFVLYMMRTSFVVTRWQDATRRPSAVVVGRQTCEPLKLAREKEATLKERATLLSSD